MTESEALLVIGELLLGAAFGYITQRWRIVYVFLIGFLGIALIADPQLPGLIGSNDGSWSETIGFVVGILVGGRIARREQMTYRPR